MKECLKFARFLIVALLYFPEVAYAWRSYQTYVGASFGMQFAQTYDIISSAPDVPSTEITFNTGLDFSGYLGYSLGDYIIVEGMMSFSGTDSKLNYFDPDDISIESTDGTISGRTTEGEYFREYMLVLNGFLFFDGGEAFVPYLGGGFGMVGADWSGFFASAILTQFILGFDVLWQGKFATFYQLRVIGVGALDFETEHVQRTYDPLTGVVITKKARYNDEIEPCDVVRLDIGVRIAF